MNKVLELFLWISIIILLNQSYTINGLKLAYIILLDHNGMNQNIVLLCVQSLMISQLSQQIGPLCFWKQKFVYTVF